MDYDERQLTSCDYDKGEMVRGKGTGTWQGVEFWCADVKEDEVSARISPMLSDDTKLTTRVHMLSTESHIHIR